MRRDVQTAKEVAVLVAAIAKAREVTIVVGDENSVKIADRIG